MPDLNGTKALIVGVANEHSIAWGCAKALKAAGAEIALTFVNEKTRKWVDPLAEEIGARIYMPMDVTQPEQVAAVFAEIDAKWGRLDTLLHSIAFAPAADLHGRVVDCSVEGWTQAMDVSVHSFLRLIKAAEPLMEDGGACMTVSYLGADRAVKNYNMMGPVKAALEASVRYAAAELGPKGITVNALSPGPLKTRAASGLTAFDELLEKAAAQAPTHHLSTIEDVGAFCAFLASPQARNVTGGVHLIDGGYAVVG
ncbi:enoyl-ACP reductase FabI [Rhodovulum sp. DZ06]|uniref:enoyl-ACP reductase FabI n=1 Tax=Rhodovulum sp. DZ06 TaxID=3425126 RepID=UPI003D343173